MKDLNPLHAIISPHHHSQIHSQVIFMKYSSNNTYMPGKDINSPYRKVCSRFVPERFSPAALAEVIDTILEQNGMASGVNDYNAQTCCYLCKTALQRNQTPTKFQQMLTFLTAMQ